MPGDEVVDTATGLTSWMLRVREQKNADKKNEKLNVQNLR